jgi:formylglycine-generating enzyme required for sulfatase activity
LLRGGSFNNQPANVRSANRNNNRADNRNNNIGFRVSSTSRRSLSVIGHGA